jgi:hypothetical protein
MKAEIMVLRHQLNVLRRRSPKRAVLNNIDRQGQSRVGENKSVDTLGGVRAEPLADHAAHRQPAPINTIGPEVDESL